MRELELLLEYKNSTVFMLKIEDKTVLIFIFKILPKTCLFGGG